MPAQHITPQMDIKGVNGVKTQNSAPGKPNNWAAPGPAEFDFRSDVVTTPTASMLAAIQSTTLLDDVFLEDPTTISLESFIAELTGHPAALLVLSGTMGNQLCLRTHLTQPPHSVLCATDSHILIHEAGGVATLSGALVNGIAPSNGHHLTLSDIQTHAVLGDEIHSCPTRVISLENTLGGEILPLEECRRISAWARSQDPPIKMHLDGARLWEACVALSTPAESAKDILFSYSACFDSVSLCFSKGLGAPIGSIIVGNKEFVKRARWIRKSIGGGLRQAGVVSAAARVSVEETFLGGLLGDSHRRAEAVGALWKERGGKLSKRVETNMVWLDLSAAGISVPKFVEVGVRYGVRLMGGRLVVHYQISDQALERLVKVMDEVLSPSGIQNGTDGEKREAQKVMAPEVD